MESIGVCEIDDSQVRGRIHSKNLLEINSGSKKHLGSAGMVSLGPRNIGGTNDAVVSPTLIPG